MSLLYLSGVLSHQPLLHRTQLIVFSVLDTALIHQGNPIERIRNSYQDGWQQSELYFNMVKSKFDHEVHAWFLMVLCLLCTLHANRAWFTFSTAVRLIIHLGLHFQLPQASKPSISTTIFRGHMRGSWRGRGGSYRHFESSNIVKLIQLNTVMVYFLFLCHSQSCRGWWMWATTH